MTPRQCYKLLGNSLSVAVVADLLQFVLLSGVPSRQPLIEGTLLVHVQAT
jgi:hypothetical protein